MYVCSFCQKICKKKNSLSNHKRRCELNPDKFPKQPFFDSLEYKEKQRKKSLGRIASNETKEKLSFIVKKRFEDINERLKHSKIMKQVVLDNPKSYSDKNIVGRSKHFIIDGIRYNSTWEYIVAECLTKQKIKWIRTGIKPENYYWNKSWHLYFPDFYLLDYDCYIEVKGYETDRDKAKWSYSKKKVFIIKQKEIKLIKEDNFDILMEVKSKSGDHLLITD